MGIVADGSDGHEFGMKSQEFSCGKNFYRDISQILGMYKFDFKSLMNYSLVKKKMIIYFNVFCFCMKY